MSREIYTSLQTGLVSVNLNNYINYLNINTRTKKYYDYIIKKKKEKILYYFLKNNIIIRWIDIIIFIMFINEILMAIEYDKQGTRINADQEDYNDTNILHNYSNILYSKMLNCDLNYVPMEMDNYITIKLHNYSDHALQIGNIIFITRIMEKGQLISLVEQINHDIFHVTEQNDPKYDLGMFKYRSMINRICNKYSIAHKIFINKIRDKQDVNGLRTFLYDYYSSNAYNKEEAEKYKKILMYRTIALKRFKNYKKLRNDNEIEWYKTYFKELRIQVARDVRSKFKDYDAYKLENITDDECNEYKLDLPREDFTLHPDVEKGFYLLKMYNDFMNLGLNKSIDKLKTCIKINNLGHKTIYLRELFKEVSEKYNFEWKERGYIKLYNIETIFGFRKDKIKEDELSKQWKNNFESDNDKNEQNQVEFFNRWFDHAIMFKSEQLASTSEVITKNNNANMFDNMYQNPQLLFDAHGATHNKYPRQTGIKRNMTKTQYFSSVHTIKPFLDNTYRRFKDGNSIVIKQETVKDRIVVNTSLDTYIPLTKIVYLLNKTLKGMPYCYGLQDYKVKSNLYGRLTKYVYYNKNIRQKFLLLPLDYSSYDTTITYGLICKTIERFAEKSLYRDEILKNLAEFKNLLKYEDIVFKQFRKRFKYRYGMLSGWKITNIVESLLNFVISYGVIQEIGEDLVDIVTMGDDLVLVIDKEGLNEEGRLSVLDKISKKYEELGFKVHPIKNLVTYNCIEFLRNYYSDRVVLNYCIRSLIPILYQQPTAELELNNYTNYKAVLDKFVLKCGLYNRLDEVMQLMRLSTNKNIRDRGYDYYKNPDNFTIENKIVYDYKYKLGVKHTHLFKYYKQLFKDLKVEDRVIENFIKNSILSRKMIMETIEYKKQKYKNKCIRIKEISKKLNMIDYIFKNLSLVGEMEEMEFNLGDYYINEILSRVNSEGKHSLYVIKQFMIQLISGTSYNMNRKLGMIKGVQLVTTRHQLDLILGKDKIKYRYDYYNNFINKNLRRKVELWFLKKSLRQKTILSGQKETEEIIRIMLGYYYNYYTNIIVNKYNNYDNIMVFTD